jgi:hypothetical protein
MKVTRIYTGADNESHLTEEEIPIDINGRVGAHSAPIKISEISFIESVDTIEYDWHPAPRRQMVIALEGDFEVETADGTRHLFKPGDILIAEDTTGHGHIARHISPDNGKRPWRIAFLPLV